MQIARTEIFTQIIVGFNSFFPGFVTAITLVRAGPMFFFGIPHTGIFSQYLVPYFLDFHVY